MIHVQHFVFCVQFLPSRAERRAGTQHQRVSLEHFAPVRLKHVLPGHLVPRQLRVQHIELRVRQVQRAFRTHAGNKAARLARRRARDPALLHRRARATRPRSSAGPWGLSHLSQCAFRDCGTTCVRLPERNTVHGSSSRSCGRSALRCMSLRCVCTLMSRLATPARRFGRRGAQPGPPASAQAQMRGTARRSGLAPESLVFLLQGGRVLLRRNRAPASEASRHLSLCAARAVGGTGAVGVWGRA